MPKRFHKLTLENTNLAVLVADNDEIATVTIRNLLTPTYKVYITNLTADISGLIKKHRPQIILVCQQMKNKSGLEILAEIKAKHPEIIGIIMTTYKDLPDVLAGMNQGIVFYYVRKPINIEHLKNTIHRAALQYLADHNQKTLLKTIKKQNTELNKENARKTEFIRHVSHRISTPLSAIRAAAELILSDPKVSEQQTYFNSCKSIYKNSLILTQTINNLTILGKIEISEFNLILRELKISELISSLQDFTKNFLEEKQISLESPTVPNETFAHDKDLLVLIFSNILQHLLAYAKNKDSLSVKIKVFDASLEFVFANKNFVFEKKTFSELIEKLKLDFNMNLYTSHVDIWLLAANCFIKKLGGSVCLTSNKADGTEYTVLIPKIKH